VVTDPLGRAYDHGYDPNGNRQSLSYPNGTATSYAYDDLNRLKTLTTTGPLGTVQGYTFTLGAAGNRERIDEADGSVRSYGYDNLYRLTSETVTGLLRYSKGFSYDAVGNRQQQTTTGSGSRPRLRAASATAMTTATGC
jgi:YD repeat-containing protein